MDNNALHTDRRLVAIMFTDIEGYTALMQQSESEAWRIRNLHREIFQETTLRFSGEIIHYYGDGTLSIFNSAVEAVRCAVHLQEELQAEEIPTRIGIHLGDILITEDDIIGDGVNVASRIESLAVAGSILISGRLVEELKNQDDLQVTSMGSFKLKNVRKALEIFAVDDPRLVVPDRHQLLSKLDTFKAKNRKLLTILGSLLLIAVLTISWLLFSASSINFPERGWLVVADIENHTGDSMLTGSLDQVMVSAIRQSRYVNVFPQAHIRQTMQRMGIKDPSTLQRDQAVEVAVRENLDAVLTSRIEQIGDTYVFTSEIIDPYKGSVLSVLSSRTDNKDHVLDALDRLTKKLRRKLGETIPPQSQDSLPLARATTHSLSALKDFSLGNQYWVDNQYDKAVELYKNAVELDSTFAWAHVALGSYYYWAEKRPLGEEHFQVALAQLENLNEREQLWIRSNIEGSRGDKEQSNNLMEIYLDKYPDDFVGWYNLGTGYMRLGQYQKGLTALERAISIFKNFKNAYINIATIYSLQENHAQALKYYHQAYSIDSAILQNFNINREYGLAYMALDSLSRAREIFQSIAGGDEPQKASSHRSLALIDMYEGLYDSAIYRLKQAVIIHEGNNQWTSEARDRMYLALAYLDLGNQQQAEQEMKAAEAIATQQHLTPNWLKIIGTARARQGNLTQAAIMLELMEQRKNNKNSSDVSAWNLLQGEIAMAQGRHEEALPLLEKALAAQDNNYSLESLAYCHYKAGHFSQARDLYLKLIGRHSLGWEAQRCWMEAHYNLALVYESLGNKAAAKEYYEKLINRWQQGNHELVLLAAAKENVKRL